MVRAGALLALSCAAAAPCRSGALNVEAADEYYTMLRGTRRKNRRDAKSAARRGKGAGNGTGAADALTDAGGGAGDGDADGGRRGGGGGAHAGLSSSPTSGAPSMNNNMMEIMRVTVVVGQLATRFVSFSMDTHHEVPIRVENYSRVALKVRQRGVAAMHILQGAAGLGLRCESLLYAARQPLLRLPIVPCCQVLARACLRRVGRSNVGVKTPPYEKCIWCAFDTTLTDFGLPQWEEPGLPHDLEVMQEVGAVWKQVWVLESLDSSGPLSEQDRQAPLRKRKDLALEVKLEGPTRVVCIRENGPAGFVGFPRRLSREAQRAAPLGLGVTLAGLGFSFIVHQVPPHNLLNRQSWRAEELVHAHISTIELSREHVVNARGIGPDRADELHGELEMRLAMGSIKVDNKLDELAGSAPARGKYNTILAPMNEQPAHGGTPFVRALLRKGARARQRRVASWRELFVDVQGMAVNFDGELIERTLSTSLFRDGRPRTVWLLRGLQDSADSAGIGDILREEARACCPSLAAPARLFCEKLVIRPLSIVVSHSGLPSVIAADGSELACRRWRLRQGRGGVGGDWRGSAEPEQRGSRGWGLWRPGPRPRPKEKRPPLSRGAYGPPLNRMHTNMKHTHRIYMGDDTASSPCGACVSCPTPWR